MIRVSLALAALALSGAPAAAATYSAKPVVAPSAARIVIRDVSWACGAGFCTGSTANGRPAVLCQAFAKKAGRVESFTVDGRAFDAAELERCNSAARATDRPVAVVR